MKTVLLALLLIRAVIAKEVDECFQGMCGKTFELISLFLPSDPVIANFFPLEEPRLHKQWPKGRLVSIDAQSERLDLLHIPLYGAVETFKKSPHLLKAKVLYIDLPLFPYPEGSFPYWELKYFLEDRGFTLLSHWYKEGAEGSIVFVNEEFFYGPETKQYLKTHSITADQYAYYPLIVFPTYYGPVRYCLENHDEHDSVKRTLKTGVAYEGNLSRIMHALIRPGSLAIDIGAHIGAHTIFMSRKAGDTGAVIAFEPSKQLYMEHLHNLEINGCRNVLSICKGIGDVHKRVLLKGIEIEQAEPVLNGTEEFIDVIPLDSLRLTNVSLIKIDIENYEYYALKGAKQTLIDNQPLILFECWIGHAPEHRDQVAQKKNFERVITFLESLGYEIYIIFNCDFLAVPIGYRDDSLEYFKTRFQKLDLKTYMDDETRDRIKASVVSPFE